MLKPSEHVVTVEPVHPETDDGLSVLSVFLSVSISVD